MLLILAVQIVDFFLRLIKEITIFAMCILIILIFAVAMLADVTSQK